MISIPVAYMISAFKPNLRKGVILLTWSYIWWLWIQGYYIENEYILIKDIYTITLYKLNLNLTIGVDKISLWLIILSIMIVYVIDTLNRINNDKEEMDLYWMSIAIIIFVFVILDFIVFYITFELVLLPLIYILKYTLANKEYRALKISKSIDHLIFFSLFGSFMLLLAICYIISIFNSSSYLVAYNLGLNDSFWVSFFLFLAFCVKIPIFPFYLWLPLVHSEANTRGSILLASLVLKLGTYGILRFCVYLFHIDDFLLSIFLTLIIVSIFLSSLNAIRQIDLKKLIAYTSIAHMNIATLGILSLNSIGSKGVLLNMVSHGLISTGLFLLIGCLVSRYQVRTIKYFRGLSIGMPLWSFFWLIFNLANIGLPPFSSFVSELAIFSAIFSDNFFLGFLASFSIFLSGVYGIWLITRINYGKCLHVVYNDLSIAEFYLLSFLIFWALLLGIFSNSLI